MLVQAQVVPWWGTGRPAELSPSGSQPRHGHRHRQEDRRVRLQNQILPLTGNRKPASDRGHWLQPAPCSSRRRSCPGGERGDRQSSVSADFHPVTGIAYRQEDRRVRLQNRVASTSARRATRTLSRNEKFEFFWCPSPGGRSVREITSREETERPPEESARQIPAGS